MSSDARPKRRDAGRPRGAFITHAVLSATLDELAAHGPGGLSIERIAKAAQVNKTTVYRRWPTREALIAGALEHVVGELSMAVVDTGSLAGDLRRVAEQLNAFLQTPAARSLALVALSSDMDTVGEELARRQLEQTAGPMLALIQRAVERGEWRPDARPDAVLSLLVGGLVHRVLIERQPVDPGWMDTAIDVLAAGVAPRAPVAG